MLNSVVSVFQYFLPIIVMLLIAFVLQKLYVSLLIKVGGRPLLYVPASFSVPVHELSHYLAAKLCLHKVEKVVFFQPNAIVRTDYFDGGTFRFPVAGETHVNTTSSADPDGSGIVKWCASNSRLCLARSGSTRSIRDPASSPHRFFTGHWCAQVGVPFP